MKQLQMWYGLYYPRMQFFLAGVCGALLTLCFPPFGWSPLAVPALLGLLLLCDGEQTLKVRLRLGWWFGFCHLLTSFYWITWALTVDLNSFGWLIPFALLLVPAGLGLYFAALGGAMHVAPKGPLARVLYFSLAWVMMEWVRGHAFTGLPWNLLGYSWSYHLPLLQSARLWSIYGLSLFCCLCVTLPYLYVRGVGRMRWMGLVLPVLLLSGLWVDGTHYIAQMPAKGTDHTGILLRLVQPNIRQELKYDPEQSAKNLARYIALSVKEGPKPQLVIWAESAVTEILPTPFPILSVLQDAIPQHGALITGVLREEHEHWYNSVIVVEHPGHVTSYYDKVHLVPFGEYVPFRWFTPVSLAAEGFSDLTEGQNQNGLYFAQPISAASPLVCYEGIFPGEAVKDPGSKWLLNITNDGWFGDSIGPYQHFYAARMRTIEQGLPLVRVASTGISAVVDAVGRILVQTPLGAEAVVDAYLPDAVSRPTGFARYRFRPFWLLMGGVLLFMISLWYTSIYHHSSQKK